MHGIVQARVSADVICDGPDKPVQSGFLRLGFTQFNQAEVLNTTPLLQALSVGRQVEYINSKEERIGTKR